MKKKNFTKNGNKFIVSEFVSFGHPDKIADQISDAILDAFLEKDANARTGIEVMVKDNIVVLGGEVNSTATVDYDSIVRQVYSEINFPDTHNLMPHQIKVINLIGKQSTEIHNGVDKVDEIGAGDQGFMVGYASNETSSYMPLGYDIARRICNFVSRQNGLGPDTKTQVIVEYDNNNKAINIHNILVSTMHQYELEEVRKNVIRSIKENEIGLETSVYDKFIKDKDIKIDVNPCGTWNIGGPVSDCGITGRKLVVDSYGGYSNIGGGAYCVDGDTEYIAEDLKWHKISQYNGGKVGQWNNGLLQFVMPSKYHVNDSEKMYHFTTPNSIDMVLSQNHDIVAKTSKNNIYKIKVKDVLEKIKTNATSFKDTIPCTFDYHPTNKGVDLTNEQIRLQVAFCADGTYNSVNGDKGRINIKKKNKIERLEWLLKETNTEYHLLDKGEYQNHYYTFVPPVPNNKSLYSIFKNANYEQLCIIGKEVLKWDGDEKKGIFRTTIKEDADFVQFIFSLVYGKHSTITIDNRIGTNKTLNEKEYKIKTVCYEVNIGKVNDISFGGGKNKLTIEDYQTDKMYCFTVPSGMLLLRRNNKIFVSGNCGKDFTKVDRSAAYMARYIAKNIVASGLSDTARVTLSYMIGIAEPCSIEIVMNRNEEKIPLIKDWLSKYVDMTPSGIIKRFGYGDNSIVFKDTARYGHFGVEGRKWEETDIAEELNKVFNNDLQ